jgi:hypothetical protein
MASRGLVSPVLSQHPTITLDRIRALEQTAEAQVKALGKMLNAER